MIVVCAFIIAHNNKTPLMLRLKSLQKLINNPQNLLLNFQINYSQFTQSFPVFPLAHLTSITHRCLFIEYLQQDAANFFNLRAKHTTSTSFYYFFLQEKISENFQRTSKILEDVNMLRHGSCQFGNPAI